MSGQMQHGQWPQGATQARAGAAHSGPFAGVPVGDYVRDAAAAVLLAVSLALPWDFAHDATGRVDVVLVTIVSLLSLTLPYLARVGAFGPGFTVAVAGTVRLVANLPYLAVVVVYLVVDGVQGGSGSGGIGAAAAVGLAGAVLAGQERQHELDDPGRAADPVGSASWVWVLGGLAAVLVLVKLVTLVIFATQVGDVIELAGYAVVLGLVVTSLLMLLIVGWPLVGTLRRDAPSRLALVGVAAPVAGFYLLAEGEGFVAPSVESLHTLAPALVLWPAIAAAAVAPGVRRAMRPVTGPALWRGAAVRALTLVAVTDAVAVALSLLSVVESDERGRPVVLVVLGALSAVAALVARSALVLDQPGSRGTVYGGAGALVVLGIVELAVVASDDGVTVTSGDLVVMLVLPVLVGVLLAVPAILAAARGTTVTPVAAAPAPTAAGPAPAPVLVGPPPPVATPSVSPPPPPSPVSAEVRQAMDPTTPLAVLADLAARAPETHVHLARNPASYPALLDWLASLGDAEIDAALAERTR